MLTIIRNTIVYSPQSSTAIGNVAGQQRQAYNAAIDYALAHPNVSKFDMCKELTKWRGAEPAKWAGHLVVQRPGLIRGREAVRAFDNATKETLKECQKEVAGKKFKDRKQDPDTKRLYRGRKERLVVLVDDRMHIKLPGPKTLRAGGVVVTLGKSVPEGTDIRAVQILERRSSCNKGRNRPLASRSYKINLIVAVPDTEPKNPLFSPIGLDAGINHTLADSEGNFYDQPMLSADRIEALISRRNRLTYKSRQWRKVQKQINRERRKNQNIKDNWEQHVAKDLATRHSMVVMEDLKHKNLRRSARGTRENPGNRVAQKRGLNRSWANARPGAFRTKQARQCEKTGARFGRVPARYTSQTCPVCGHRAGGNRKSQAGFVCLDCGFSLNADVVGAVNVMALGVLEVLEVTGEVCRGEGVSSSGAGLGSSRGILALAGVHPGVLGSRASELEGVVLALGMGLRFYERS